MLPRIKGLSSLEVGALATEHVLSQESLPVTSREATLNLGLRFVEKLYVGGRWTPARDSWAVSLGITDLNGLVYWWLR